MKKLLVAAVLVVLANPLHAAQPRLAHMVFFTLAEDTEANRETLVAACQDYLSDHEGAVHFSVGTINEELDREVNDADFDVALHVVFASREHHDNYQTHPQHLKFIEENQHLWSAVRVFDSNVASPRHDGIPGGGRRFAGMLTGTVVRKQGGQFVVNVTEVGQLWSHSKAEDPQSLVGKKLLVRGRVKEPAIRRFIGLLKVGETVTVDVAHKSSDHLRVLELTEAQRQRVK